MIYDIKQNIGKAKSKKTFTVNLHREQLIKNLGIKLSLESKFSLFLNQA